MSKIYKHPDYIKLRKLAPNAKGCVLTCSDNCCSNNYDTNTTQFVKCATEGEWLLNLSCKVCKSKWSICMTCPKFKTKLLKNRMIFKYNIKDDIIVKKSKINNDKVITNDDDSPNKDCTTNESSTITIHNNNNNINDIIDPLFNIDDYNYAIKFQKKNPGVYPTKMTSDLFSNYQEYTKSFHSNDMYKILTSLRPYTWVLGDAITRLLNI